MANLSWILFTFVAIAVVPVRTASKRPSRIRRSGPNVCGRANPGCCSGWQPSGADRGLCIQPICSFNCGTGLCVRPNVCYCQNGQYNPTCKQTDKDCKVRCLNGGTCKDDKCQCPEGFVGRFCENPVCGKPCLNGGKCISPNTCACLYGFAGPTCESDYRQGPCYKEIKDRTCQGQITTLMCTKELCCATVGKAWGAPCEQCPAKPEPCRKGYLPDYASRECLDIDECRAVPDVCGENGKCRNTVGSYACERCQVGYQYNDQSKRCQDVDECSDRRTNRCLNGRCENTLGSFTCVCDQGFVLISDGSCRKPGTTPTPSPGQITDFCFKQIINNACARRLSINVTKEDCCCSILRGVGWSQRCERCPVESTDDYNALCSLVGPCKAKGDRCLNGICDDQGTGLKCRCNAGFKLALDGRCVDLDECDQSSSVCTNGVCRNTLGSFACDCSVGYVRGPNPLTCVLPTTPTSKPEGPGGSQCLKEGEICENGVCSKINGILQCSCNSGFKYVGNKCIATKCSREGETCENGVCSKINGILQCSCNSGFKYVGNKCVDRNECNEERGNICRDGRCINIHGSFECDCASGYKQSNDKKGCLDVNECIDSEVCKNGRCINIKGAWRCECNQGFALSRDEKTCIDIDECRSLDDVCNNGICVNTPGDYYCRCNTGYSPSTDRHMCLDTMQTECYGSFANGVCSNMLFRSLTISQCCCGMDNSASNRHAWGNPCTACPIPKTDEFKKVCVNGRGKDSSGKDIDECSNNVGSQTDLCPNARCRNTNGDYICDCKPGYRRTADRKQCQEVDECRENPSLCHRGRCENVPGSYRCVCPKGFVFDAKTKGCEDQDECKTPNQCIDGTCVNNVGSFKCQCAPDLTLHHSGRLCEDLRKGKCWRTVSNNICEDNVNGDVTQEVCCQTLGKAWGSPCKKCPASGNKCRKGYVYRNFTCVDNNECESFPGICRNGRCLNTIGSYRCECSEGLTLDETNSVCLDQRERVCYQTVTRDKCTKPVRGFYKKNICCCSVGAAWGSPCEECPLTNTREFNELCRDKVGTLTRVNECNTFPGICANGECIDTAKGFICNCRFGFDLDETGRNCTDIDECSLTPDLCGNGTCLNVPGAFRCNCRDGFKNAPMMMEVCIDVNECDDLSHPCQGGSCINTIGSFKCQCPPGKRMDSSGLMCQDINECSENSFICANGICQNFMGGYQCACYRGFQPSNNMKNCVDMNECLENNGGCETICRNTIGSFRCDCPPGLRLASDARSCEDIDECTETPEICGVGNRCRNVRGGHICSCSEAYTLSEDRKSCIDIDECISNPDICVNGRCENLLGTFRCVCPEGFTLGESSLVCIDVNECDTDVETRCDKNSLCVNSLGSYSCTCKQGFEKENDNCIDINECAGDDASATCGTNAVCINIDGSYLCQCEEGYKGDGKACSDIDECNEKSLTCSNGKCMNAPGSYECECDFGYLLTADKKGCEDVDECSALAEFCHHGRCENIPGSFQCICDKGFQLNRFKNNCTDMNECTKTGMCLNGRCVNEMGRYRCECDEDFLPNPTRTACVDTRRGQCLLKKGSGLDSCSHLVSDNELRAYCCCSVGEAWNDPCEECPVNGTESYDHLCPSGAGFVTDVTTTSVLDIDECKFPRICVNGTCENTLGSYTCTCPYGYEHNPGIGVCQDIDECSRRPFICGWTGVCMNRIGGYTCKCPPGEHQVGSLCVDSRLHACYKDVQNLDDIEGSTPGSSCLRLLTPKRITRQECCCTMGTAYGHPDMCKACPVRNTDEFTALCPTDGTKPATITPTGITGPGGGTPFPPGGTPGVVRVEDIDECSIIPDLCMMGRCVNNYGSYTCECKRGFVSRERNTKCLDMNECILEPCVNGECKNTFGSFMCTCSKGYDVDETGLTCVDQNECHLNGTCANGKCTNLVGDYRCSCNPGFIPARNGKACVDVNECLRRSDICRNGTCVNEVGSYSCRCNEGYREDFRHVCQDVDECTEQPNQVCRNGVCIDTVGSFTCTCKIGYTVDDTKRNCRDINECREVSGYCQDGDCTNTIGGSRCECSNGYKLHPAGDQCVDINECDEDPNLCEMNGDCANTPGSFYCICPNGYKLANDGRMCVDMRSRYCFDHFDSRGCSSPRIKNVTKSVCCCTKGTSWGEPCELCPQEQSANFALLCPKGIGYAVITNKVEDVNECEKNPMLCKNGRCINNDGSYRCQCFAGYVLDVTGRNCKDKDECRVTGACGNGTCTNTPGSFSCDCAEGFKSGSLSPKCEDINECLETRKLCAFRCENSPGSYFCSCPRGYKLHADGRHCTDINECSAGTHNCRYVCKNFVGGFKCICPEGFRAIGRTRRCEDINECLRGGLCSNGACRNTPGNFICDCDAGYKRSLDGKSCEDLRRSLCFSQVDNGICKGSTKMMMMVTKSECCCTAGIAWGSQCVACPRKGTRERRQLCIGAREIDECKMVPGLCPNGKCINTDGSYRCMCNPGFQLSRDGKSCRDIDECIQTPRPCQNQCENTPGSYRCRCPIGYQQGRNQRTCVDVDECANRTHNCQNTCLNTIGSYTCSCPKGYKQSGSSCVDINECQERANICVFGTCINRPGSHSCMCNRGYKYNPLTKTCVDLNECKVRSCQGTCRNLNGGYRCGCGSGYVRQLYWNRCIDVNECTTGANKCGRTQCVNIAGGYRCSCPRGFQLDRFRMTCSDFNECSRSPCSTTGCFNIRGGFQCTCPTGFYPIGGGHCISRYGQTCYNCAGRNSRVQRPKSIVTKSGYKFGEKPKETGARPARTYQSQSHNPYGSSQGYKSQQQKPADTYRYTYSYGSSSGGRKRRASHFVHKLRITVPRNVTARRKLLQLTPALESLQKAFHYEMVRGNKNLFEIKVRKGVTFLHSKKALKKYPGLYKVYLRGRTTDEFRMERPFEVVEEIEFSGAGVEKKPKANGNTSTEKRGSDIVGLSEAKKFHLEIFINVV